MEPKSGNPAANSLFPTDSIAVIAVIDDPRVVEKILRHLGAWHDPPPRPRPPSDWGPYSYEPCDDVDPMPDYETS